MLGLGTTISKTGKLGVHDLGIVTSNLVLKHNYDLSSVQPLSDGAAVFDGVDDYINIDEGFAATNRTFTAWFNSSQNAITGSYGNTILSQTTSSGGNRWHIRIDASDNEIKVYDGGAVQVAHASTGITIVEGQWYHVAITDNSSSVALYINGILQNSASFTTENDATDVFTIGQEFDGGSPSDFFKGYVCNVGVWDAILSQTEIKSIMWKNYAGLTSSEKTDLVSWWNLDTAYDSSVFDNHHSAGDTLGSELIINGSFTDVADETDVVTLSGWATYNTPTSRNVVDNKLVIVTTGANQGAKYTVSLSSGTYKLSVDVTGDTGAGGIYISTDSSTTYSITTSVGTVEYYFYASSSTIIYFRAANNLAGTTSYTNISVKLVNGNSGTLS